MRPLLVWSTHVWTEGAREGAQPGAVVYVCAPCCGDVVWARCTAGHLEHGWDDQIRVMYKTRARLQNTHSGGT